MNNRERWINLLNYKEVDEIPVPHWDIWPETKPRWEKEGMPKGLNSKEIGTFVGADRYFSWVGPNLGIFPKFEEVVIEEDDEKKVFKDGDGVIQEIKKNESSIPHYVDYTLKEAEDWPEYKKRLQPHPDRLAIDGRKDWFEDMLKRANTVDDAPVVLGLTSMMGWIRNWMGVENMSYLFCDDPECFGDMVNTLADLSCWAMDEILPKMDVMPDMIFSWEDIAGSTGPFVSPDIFNEYVAPGYRKIKEKALEYGIELYCIDSDGDVEVLIQPWLDSGVNVIFPLEPGTWGATPEDVKSRYDKELRVIGGFNKLVLEKDFDAIDKEIEKHLDLIKQGGYVMMPDHLITPDTPLENYQYFIKKMREISL